MWPRTERKRPRLWLYIIWWLGFNVLTFIWLAVWNISAADIYNRVLPTMFSFELTLTIFPSLLYIARKIYYRNLTQKPGSAIVQIVLTYTILYATLTALFGYFYCFYGNIVDTAFASANVSCGSFAVKSIFSFPFLFQTLSIASVLSFIILGVVWLVEKFEWSQKLSRVIGKYGVYAAAIVFIIWVGLISISLPPNF